MDAPFAFPRNNLKHTDECFQSEYYINKRKKPTKTISRHCYNVTIKRHPQVIRTNDDDE